MSIIKEKDLKYIGAEVFRIGENEEGRDPNGTLFYLKIGNYLEYLTLKLTLESLGYSCDEIYRNFNTNKKSYIIYHTDQVNHVYTTYPFDKLMKTLIE
jgi:hypothetical protein